MPLHARLSHEFDRLSRKWRVGLGLILAGAAGFGVVGQMSSQADEAGSPRLVSSISQGVNTSGRASGKLLTVALTAPAEVQTEDTEAAEIAEARSLIARSKQKFAAMRDYTCDFYKRERLNGRLLNPHKMSMKARTAPASLYFKFVQPNRGREAIYIEGRNNGRVLAHDVGVVKLLGGTMWLDPNGSMAMTDNRHPITEAGLGQLISTVSERWDVELAPDVSDITIEPNVNCDGRICTMVDSTHPVRRQDFFFYKVRLFFDDETHLPIRFEAYDWPKADGTPGDLIEEYAYSNLRTNVGLTDRDFDTANPEYSFGRF